MNIERHRRALVSLSSLMCAVGGFVAVVGCGEGAPSNTGPSEPFEQVQSALPPITNNTFGTFTTPTAAQPWPGHMLAPHATLIRDVFNQNNSKILVVAGSSYNVCDQDLTPTNPIDHQGFPDDGRPTDPGVIKEEARLYDIATGTWSAKLGTPAPYGVTWDAFCSGHVHDSEGGVVFQGGLLNHGKWNGIGIRKSARYAFWLGTFAERGYTGTGASRVDGSESQLNNYHDDNYYPTLVAGPLHTYVFPGSDGEPRKPETDPSDNHIHKLKNPNGTTTTTNWVSTGVVHETMGLYPRVHLIPDGRFFVSSPAAAGEKSTFYHPVAQTKVPLGSAPNVFFNNGYNTSPVLAPLTASSNGVYANPTVVQIGGEIGERIDLGAPTPVWSPTAARSATTISSFTGRGKVRLGAMATLLPTGQMLVSTGTEHLFYHDSQATRMVELYDPELDLWMDMTTNLNPVVRSYHSVSLLVPDGRVWSASGNVNGAGSDVDGAFGLDTVCDGAGDWAQNTVNSTGDAVQESWEMFNPWYMTASRPVITNSSDPIINDGSSIAIQIGNSEGASITRVALMRAGSGTHAFDGDQRLIWLTIQPELTTASQVVVSAPNGAAAAPPGDYMLFVLKAGPEPNGIKRFIPSVGRWVRVSNPSRAQILPANYDTTIGDAGLLGLRPAAVDAFEEGGVVKLNIVYTRNDAVQWFTKADMTAAQFLTELNAHPAPYRLVSLDSYQSATGVRYVAVWNTSAAPAGAVTQRWYDASLATHNANVATFEGQGYRLVAVSTVMVSGTPRYTAFMDKAAVGTKSAFLARTAAQVAALVTSEAPKRLAYISAYMEGTTAKFNVIFNSFDAGVNPNARDQSNALLKEYALGQVGLTGFATAEEQRMQQGYSLRQIAGYQVSGVTRYSGVWSLRPQL